MHNNQKCYFEKAFSGKALFPFLLFLSSSLKKFAAKYTNSPCGFSTVTVFHGL